MTMTRQELYDAVWARTVRIFAAENELNYSRLLKLLKEEQIPRPSRKEVELIKQGEAGLRLVRRPPLPGDPASPVTLPRMRGTRPFPRNDPADAPKPKPGAVLTPRTVLRDFERHPRWKTLYFLPPAERRRVIRETERIAGTPEGKLHPRTRKLQRDVAAWEAQVRILGGEARAEESLAKPDILKRVSTENAERVLRILDALYRSVTVLGGEVQEDGSVRVLGEVITLSFKESRTKVPHKTTLYEETGDPPEEPPKWDLRFTGKLTLSVGYLYAVRDRKDSRIEDRLGDVLELLYQTAFQLTMKSDPAVPKESAQDRSYTEEMERMEELLRKARDYEDAARIRRLIKGVQHRIATGDLDYSDRFAEWAVWASDKAAWLDPTEARYDEILGRRHEPILRPPDGK